MSFIFERSNLTEWLAQHEWSAVSRGELGELWSRKGQSETQVAVPKSFDDDPRALEATVERLAYWEQMSPDILRRSLLLWNVDVSEFRSNVGTDTDFGVSAAQLKVVNDLLSGADRIWRAVAHTALKQTAQVGNLSAADEVRYESVMAGFTEKGSYKLPVYVKLGKPTVDNALPVIVPDEKRVMTSSLAKALQAVNEFVIKPPTFNLQDDDLREMVNLGVSRELIVGIAEILSEGSNDATTEFEWAPSHSQTVGANSLPRHFEFSASCHDLLTETANRLTVQIEPEKNTFVGKLLGVEKEALDSDLYQITLAVPKNSERLNPDAEMNYKLQVSVSEQDYDLRQIFNWLEQKTTVRVRGVVNRNTTPRHMENPESFAPMWIQSSTDDELNS